MKPIDTPDSPEQLEICPRCGENKVRFFHSEKIDGYYVSECEQCGAYSEIMRADVFGQYRPQRPKKTGDQKEPWVSRLMIRHSFHYTDRRTSMIGRIFKKIKEKK